MRNLHDLDSQRVTKGPLIARAGGYIGDDTCGAFILRSPVDGGELHVIAAAAEGWDHVSVTCKDRCPTWAEMEHVKRRFFKEDEVAMQLHVAPKNHINFHSRCLHLWRSHSGDPPLPPAILV